MLVLYNVHMDMVGPIDFSAANARSSAQLRVKGLISHFFTSSCGYNIEYYYEIVKQLLIFH